MPDGFGAAICFQSRIFRGEISRKIREILKKARRGFSDLLQGMWDYIKSYEHHLNTLNTPWASLSSPKVPLRPWCPEIFGGNHPEFLEISDFCLDLWHGYHRNRLDEPVKNFDFFLDFRPWIFGRIEVSLETGWPQANGSGWRKNKLISPESLAKSHGID